MGTGIHDMIERCREAGLPEPEFKLTDGFVTVIRRKQGKAFEAVGGKITPGVTEQASEQAAEQVTEQVGRLLRALAGRAAKGQELMERLGLSHRPTFLYNYLQPAIEAGLVEMTIPDKPRSSKQQYRLTEKGMTVVR